MIWPAAPVTVTGRGVGVADYLARLPDHVAEALEQVSPCADAPSVFQQVFACPELHPPDAVLVSLFGVRRQLVTTRRRYVFPT